MSNFYLPEIEYYLNILIVLLLIGYFTVNYFIGYSIGKIQYINKVFNFKKFWLYVIFLPLIITIIIAIFSSDTFSIVLGKYLFTTIIASLTILMLVFAGTKQLIKQYKIVKFYNEYGLAIIILIITSIYYYNYQFVKNKNVIVEVVINNVSIDTIQYKNERKEATKKYIKSLKEKEEDIINNFDKLSKQYKNEINILEENKDLIKTFYDELNDIKEKNVQLTNELLKVNENLTINESKNKKNYNHIQLILNNLNQINTTISTINLTNIKNKDKIISQQRDIDKIKYIQLRLSKNDKNYKQLKKELNIVNKKIKNKKNKKLVKDNNSTTK